MEILSACQALDLLAPLKPSAAVAAAHDYIRKTVPFAKVDRVFSKDVAEIRKIISENKLLDLVKATVGELEF